MRRALLLSLLATCGCYHVHLEQNAPGNVELESPPVPGERPEDPGERLLVVNAGPFVTGGLTLGGVGSPDGIGALGVEASVHLGENERSHEEDSLVPYPASSVGVNLGATLLGSDHSRSAGTLYAELQATETLVGLAWGLAFTPSGSEWGPQATICFGPLLVRGAYLGAGRGELGVGLVIKGAGIWSWSQ